MESSDHLRISAIPTLREPILLAAFAGWNDASQVATFSLTTLLKHWSAQRFADIDPEPFFVFSETRPTISLTPKGGRSLEWPGNTFFAHHSEDSNRDIVLLVGSEPQLRWRTFCDAIVGLADRIDASCLITLGGLLAEIPHTAPVTLTGFASSADVLPQLRNLGVELSSYEGPTGIVGALHDAWRATDRPAISLWGNVPHYISASPNPQVTLALLERLSTLLGLSLPLGVLSREAAEFQARIDEALEENAEAREYVRDLEQQLGEGAAPIPAPELIEQLEEFLRGRPPDGGNGLE